MKTGIITLPFNSNYGGILQAYALQSVLENMGHETITVYRISKPMSVKMKILSYGKRLFLKVFLRKKTVIRSWPAQKERNIIAQHTDRFIRENIRITGLLKNESRFKFLEKYRFEAFVVGSDQVWRPKYSPDLKNHYLGFLKDNDKIRRVAYAASFGVDKWEYTPRQTGVCKSLSRKFHAISVREDSAVKLCGKYFEITAKRMPDPTLLLEKDVYIRLVEKDKVKDKGEIFLTYVLDMTPEKKEILQKITNDLDLPVFSPMPEKSFRDAGIKEVEKCIFPPVTEWLRGFMDARFVVTDSFHGTVFSILFNKPFLTLGNEKRGMTRFTSLLQVFGLEDRLIFENEIWPETKIRKPIDYEKVNQILKKEREMAFHFLKESLISTN